MQARLRIGVRERAHDARFGARLYPEWAEPVSALHLAAILSAARHIALTNAKEEVEALLRGQFDEGRKRGHIAGKIR